MNQHDRDYLDAWEKLDPDLREQMRSEGIDGPDLSCASGFRYDHNFIEAVGSCDQLPEIDTDEKICEVVRRIIGELLTQSNPALAIECFSLVTGIGYLGDSMTEIGKRHGVTRQSVSKRCVELADALGFDSSRAMRKRKSPKRCTQRAPEVVHPHINRIVTLYGRLRRSGWLHRQDTEQLRCICADLEPVRNICREIEALIDERGGKKESL